MKKLIAFLLTAAAFFTAAASVLADTVRVK